MSTAENGEETSVDYHEPDGICAYVRKLNEGKKAVHEPIYFKGTVDGIEAEAAFQYTEDFGEKHPGFCNNIYTVEGGTHITGFKTKFTTVMNQYAREIGYTKREGFQFHRSRCQKRNDRHHFRKTSGAEI